MDLLKANKSLEKSLKKIPLRIRKEYEIWKRIVEFQGLDGLKSIKGYHDEALKGKLDDLRSSRLNLKWRVIYKAAKDQFEVYVIDINPHQY